MGIPVVVSIVCLALSVGYCQEVEVESIFDLLKPRLNGAQVMDLMKSGRAGVPPNYTEVVATNFSCSSINFPGYYADVEAGCQIFHRCETTGRKDSYICSPPTVFNQITLVCDYWFQVDCDISMDVAEFANARLYLDSDYHAPPVNIQTVPPVPLPLNLNRPSHVPTGKGPGSVYTIPPPPNPVTPSTDSTLDSYNKSSVGLVKNSPSAKCYSGSASARGGLSTDGRSFSIATASAQQQPTCPWPVHTYAPVLTQTTPRRKTPPGQVAKRVDGNRRPDIFPSKSTTKTPSEDQWLRVKWEGQQTPAGLTPDQNVGEANSGTPGAFTTPAYMRHFNGGSNAPSPSLTTPPLSFLRLTNPARPPSTTPLTPSGRQDAEISQNDLDKASSAGRPPFLPGSKEVDQTPFGSGAPPAAQAANPPSETVLFGFERITSAPYVQEIVSDRPAVPFASAENLEGDTSAANPWSNYQPSEDKLRRRFQTGRGRSKTTSAAGLGDGRLNDVTTVIPSTYGSEGDSDDVLTTTPESSMEVRFGVNPTSKPSPRTAKEKAFTQTVPSPAPVKPVRHGEHDILPYGMNGKFNAVGTGQSSTLAPLRNPEDRLNASGRDMDEDKSRNVAFVPWHPGAESQMPTPVSVDRAPTSPLQIKDDTDDESGQDGWSYGSNFKITSRPASMPFQVATSKPTSNHDGRTSKTVGTGSGDIVTCVYTSWSATRRPLGRVTGGEVPAGDCTHIVYAYTTIYENKITTLQPALDETTNGGLGNLAKFSALKAIDPGLQRLVGVGGWNAGGWIFSTAFASPEGRRIFIDSVVEFCADNDLDGIFLDWLTPGVDVRGGSPDDYTNYGTLLTEMRASFDSVEKASKKKLLLTLTVSASGAYFTNYDVEKIAIATDIVYLITYDLAGYWNGSILHPSPLFNEAGRASVDGSVSMWMNAGIPSNKIVFGIPTFARTYKIQSGLIPTSAYGTRYTLDGIRGAISQAPGFLYYSETCSRIQLSGYTVVRDAFMRVPYAYSSDQMIMYEDELSVVEKVQYAKQRGLGGVYMFTTDEDDPKAFCGTSFPLTLAAASAAGTHDGKVTIETTKAPSTKRCVAADRTCSKQTECLIHPALAAANGSSDLWCGGGASCVDPVSVVECPLLEPLLKSFKPGSERTVLIGKSAVALTSVKCRGGTVQRAAGEDVSYLCVEDGILGRSVMEYTCPRGTKFSSLYLKCVTRGEVVLPKKR